MAAALRVSQGQVEALLRAFGLGLDPQIAALDVGTLNTSFSVTARGERYCLRVSDDKTPADLRWETGLLAALDAAGVPVALPRTSADGERFVSLPASDGGAAMLTACLFPWIDGVHRTSRDVRLADITAVGAALGTLHQAALSLPAAFRRPPVNDFASICRRIDTVRDGPGRDDPALARALPALAEEIPWLESRAAQRAEATRAVIHSDLFPDNVLFAGDRLAALIDFELAATGSLAADLAVCINAWCFSDDFVPARVRALVAGYQASRRLAAADVAALYAEARASAFYFTVTRITDVYLLGMNRPTKDFRRFLGRLRRWRDVGAAGLLAWAGLV